MRDMDRRRFMGVMGVAGLGLTLAGCVQPVAVQAPPPAPYRPEHPHYLHALSDLRFARWLLNRPDEYNVVREQNHAIQEIDRAMAEIRRAAIDDGRSPEDHPPVDVHLDQRGRLYKARELIGGARRDLGFEEDNFAALGWRNAAIHHVDEAHHAVEHAIRDKRWDEGL